MAQTRTHIRPLAPGMRFLAVLPPVGDLVDLDQLSPFIVDELPRAGIRRPRGPRARLD